MDMQILTTYCLTKPGSYADHPFGPDALVIKVASKMFALLSQTDGVPHISLKCDPFLAESLRQQYEAVKPGYHLNKSHWNTVRVDGSISEEELCRIIDHSYDLVFKGLKKVEKNAILSR